MRAALVKNGIVENIIVYNPDKIYTPTDGADLVLDVDQTAEIGGSYADGVFSPPNEMES